MLFRYIYRRCCLRLNAFKRRLRSRYIAFCNLVLNIFGSFCVDVFSFDLPLQLFKEVGLLKRQCLILHLGINFGYLFRASSLLFSNIYSGFALLFNAF